MCDFGQDTTTWGTLSICKVSLGKINKLKPIHYVMPYLLNHAWSSSAKDREVGTISQVGTKTCDGILTETVFKAVFFDTVERKCYLFCLFSSSANSFRVHPNYVIS